MDVIMGGIALLAPHAHHPTGSIKMTSTNLVSKYAKENHPQNDFASKCFFHMTCSTFPLSKSPLSGRLKVINTRVSDFFPGKRQNQLAPHFFGTSRGSQPPPPHHKTARRAASRHAGSSGPAAAHASGGVSVGLGKQRGMLFFGIGTLVGWKIREKPPFMYPLFKGGG